MNIVYLPIDSRPCNARFPAQLLAMSGFSCRVPESCDMDYFRTPAPHRPIADFLTRETAGADVLIVAVDQLAYGSLLASREYDVGEEEALSRVKWIATLKARNPRLKIIAFSIIMRSSTSTLRAEDVVHHRAVTAYSQAFHRAKISQSPEDQAEADRLAASIPGEILEKYHRVRARNHAVNRACLSLVQKGAIDRLLLLQEDSQPLGFHKLEQEVLAADMDRLNVKHKVAMHNGTDEGGCLCAAAAAQKQWKLHVSALDGGSCDFVAKYEDRPFMENIESHCRFAGISLTTREDADKILCVLTPDAEPQRDVLYPQMEKPEDAARNEKLAATLAGFIEGGKPVGLLDVRYANGGSIGFMEALAKKADPLALCAYAAWNTASNSLGTVLAQLALGEDADANRLFTAERLLDDLLYQAVVRGALQAELSALGEDPLSLRDKARAEKLLRGHMERAVRTSPVFSRYEVSADYGLPWPRTFEVSVTAKAVSRREEGHGNG